MMKISKQFALLTASATLVMTSFALADTATTTVISGPVSKNIIYVAGDAGFGVLSTPDKNFAEPDGFFITGASHETGYFAGGAAFGYKRAITNKVLLGAEFGYDFNGQSRYTEDGVLDNSVTGKISSWDLNLLATGTYLFTNGVNVFAKVGGADVTQSGSLSGFGGDSDTSISRVKPMVAGGVGYQFKMLDIYAQYAHIFGKDAQDFDDLFNADGTFTDVVSVDTIKLGVAFNIAI